MYKREVKDAQYVLICVLKDQHFLHMKMDSMFMQLHSAFLDGKIWIKSMTQDIELLQGMKIYLIGILIGEKMAAHQG